MINGIYQSATGLSSLTQAQESIANNLANINSQGFKKASIQFQQLANGTIGVNTSLDMAPGPVQITDQAGHVALTGEGFFVVNTPQGTAYTRNGAFGVDAEGKLVTAQGFAVQGEQGEISIGAKPFSISAAGEVISEDSVLDKLQIVAGDAGLQPVGNGLWTAGTGSAPEPLAAGKLQLLPGALEGSNVNLLQSMVDMLSVARLYEANQKALESQDETLKQAVTQVGRTA